LDRQYADNEQTIADMNNRLQVAQGNLGELFGVTRQIAGDVSGVLSGSLINTQLVTPPGEENRVDFLRRVAAATALPSLRELEDLWIALMTETMHDAEVVRYTTPVLQEDGITSVPTEVVRIGSYTAVGDGKYLGYLPNANTLFKLTRQPPDR